MDRRAFFRGTTGRTALLRPPFSIEDEIEFFDTCTACGDCIDVCPTGILISDSQNRPHVDFSNGLCTFCKECATSCQVDAIRINDENAERPWTLKAHLNDTCLENKGISCRACEFECGEGAIRFRPQLGGRSLVQIDATRCTGCGECIGVCPSDTISIRPHEGPSKNEAEAHFSNINNKESAQC